MNLLRSKQQKYTVNGKSQITKNIVRKSINLLNTKRANKYHTTCKSSKYSLDNLKKMSEESSKQASKQAVASNLVQPSKVMISKQDKTPSNLLARTKNAATSQFSTIKANLINKFTSSNQPATPIANAKIRATALNSVTRSIKATSNINPVSKPYVPSTPTAFSVSRKATILKTPSTVHSFQTKSRVNLIQNDKRLVNSSVKPTYSTRTPATKTTTNNISVKKNISRTVDCAKTAIRRSIRLLNSPPNSSLTPNTYRRNLFPVNAGQKNTKIPILTNNNDRDFSKTDAGPQRTVNIIKNEQKPSKRKSLMARSARLSSGLNEDTCVILTPKLMRQLIDSVTKARANRAALIENNVQEDEEEEEIKIQSVKPTSLLKYLLKENHLDATLEHNTNEHNQPSIPTEVKTENEYNSVTIETDKKPAENKVVGEEMHVDESEKLPMENSEMIQENMNETIEIEIKEHRKTLSKVEGTQVLASIDNLARQVQSDAIEIVSQPIENNFNMETNKGDENKMDFGNAEIITQNEKPTGKEKTKANIENEQEETPICELKSAESKIIENSEQILSELNQKESIVEKESSIPQFSSAEMKLIENDFKDGKIGESDENKMDCENEKSTEEIASVLLSEKIGKSPPDLASIVVSNEKIATEILLDTEFQTTNKIQLESIETKTDSKQETTNICKQAESEIIEVTSQTIKNDSKNVKICESDENKMDCENAEAIAQNEKSRDEENLETKEIHAVSSLEKNINADIKVNTLIVAQSESESPEEKVMVPNEEIKSLEKLNEPNQKNVLTLKEEEKTFDEEIMENNEVETELNPKEQIVECSMIKDANLELCNKSNLVESDENSTSNTESHTMSIVLAIQSEATTENLQVTGSIDNLDNLDSLDSKKIQPEQVTKEQSSTLKVTLNDPTIETKICKDFEDIQSNDIIKTVEILGAKCDVSSSVDVVLVPEPVINQLTVTTPKKNVILTVSELVLDSKSTELESTDLTETVTVECFDQNLIKVILDDENIEETSHSESKNPVAEELSIVTNAETQSNLTLEESQIERDILKKSLELATDENQSNELVDHSKEIQEQNNIEISVDNIPTEKKSAKEEKPVSKRKRKDPLDEINNAVSSEKPTTEDSEPVEQTEVKKRKYTKKNKTETTEPNMIVEEARIDSVVTELVISEPIKTKRVYNKKRTAASAAEQEPASKLQKENAEPVAERILTRAQRAKMNQKI